MRRGASFGDQSERPPADPVVDLTGVTFRFPSGNGLADLDLSVPAASITVLVGPNGAGKTTAPRMVTGALAPMPGGRASSVWRRAGPTADRSVAGAGSSPPGPPSTNG